MSHFERAPDRRGTGSYKWDGGQAVFGKDNLLPFWVADMDFATPEPVLEAVRQRLAHPVLGYEDRTPEYLQCVQHWLSTRHGWDVPQDSLMFCPPSTIVAMYGLIVSLTAPGDGIVVPTPTYGPLIQLVENTGRRLIRCPMIASGKRFVLDLESLEAGAKDSASMLILCSPHNPTGRVFTRDELAGVTSIAEHSDLIVISDEVHADLLRPGFRHHPFGSLGLRRSATVISPNKTFNSAGLPQASLVIPDPAMRQALQQYLDTVQVNHDSSFGGVAMMAAYRDCADWLEELLLVLDRNHRRVEEVVTGQIEGVRHWPAEATYLAWLDYRDTGLSETEVQQRLTEIGGIGLYNGSLFGDEGRGFLRMNIACPAETLELGLDGLRKSFR